MRMFVTGIDTGVGKSVVTACLAAARRAAGSVVACKPVASGVAPGEAGEDAVRLGWAAGHPPCGFATFAAPLSPHRAAEREGRVISDDVLDQIRALSADTVLVEGVGGWRVPIRRAPPMWVADLARATGGPVVVVAADRLGVLNHTLLTVEAVRADGFEVAAVALNRGLRPDPSVDPSVDTNLDDLRALCGAPVIPVPFVPDGDRVTAVTAGEALLRGIVGASGG